MPTFIGGAPADILNANPTPAKTTDAGATGATEADRPHLTGDPEWDALELAETDPTKPPLVIQR